MKLFYYWLLFLGTLSALALIVCALLFGQSAGREGAHSSHVSPMMAIMKQLQSDLESGDCDLAKERMAVFFQKLELERRTPEQSYHDVLAVGIGQRKTNNK